MATANKVSRAKLGLLAPCNMTAAMLDTSTNVTDRVKSKVPAGFAKVEGQALGMADDRQRRPEHRGEQPQEDEHQPNRFR